jgi:pimeloyl-ACP methyl ester carboxylesterase
MQENPAPPSGGLLYHQVSGQGAPLVLIQGVGVHHTGYSLQLPALEPRFRCLVCDNRGVGRSPAPAGRLTVDGMARDVLDLMDAQGWASAHLAGHSLGGLVALRVAQRHRKRVQSLALLCTFADGRRAGAGARMALLGLRSRIGTRAMRRQAFLEILADRQSLEQADRIALAERMAALLGHDLADHAPIEMAQLRAMRACDARPGLAALAGLPTLVLGGDEDPISPPATTRAIAEGIPGARCVILERASHGVIVHQPERVNPLLLEHLTAAEAAMTQA